MSASSLPRGLIVTCAAVSALAIALGLLLVLPRAGLQPQRAPMLEFDLPTPAIR